jgi:D-lactate dehydrogenase
MKVAVFSTMGYDRRFLQAANAQYGHELTFLETRLTAATAGLAAGHDAVCPFVNDDVSAPTLEALRALGVRLAALRSAGFNHVDVGAAERLGVTIARVPAYSPHAVAEHAIGLLLTLNRKFHRAYNRVREGNFSLEGLVGFDLYGKTVGVVGTGKIGTVLCRILRGFGCRIMALDSTAAQISSISSLVTATQPSVQSMVRWSLPRWAKPLPRPWMKMSPPGGQPRRRASALSVASG